MPEEVQLWLFLVDEGREDQNTTIGRPSSALPLLCSPPLVLSALDEFLRRTTFKYAATALENKTAKTLLSLKLK